MSSPKIVGGSVQVMDLVRALCSVNSEAVVQVGGDGCLYFAHRFRPDLIEGKLDLGASDEPRLERIEGAVGMIGAGLEENWLDFDAALDLA